MTFRSLLRYLPAAVCGFLLTAAPARAEAFDAPVVPDAPRIVAPGSVIQSAPEPATLILLGMGLTAIAVRQRRLMRRKQ